MEGEEELPLREKGKQGIVVSRNQGMKVSQGEGMTLSNAARKGRTEHPDRFINTV